MNWPHYSDTLTNIPKLMNYYVRGLSLNHPAEKVICFSGTPHRRILHLYPHLDISSLEDWESALRDDGVDALDEDGDKVPSHLLIHWIDSSTNLSVQHETQPVI